MSGDPRSEIGKALADKLSPEQLDFLLNEVLAIKKRPRAEIVCKNKSCGQRQIVNVEIPDAKAVTDSLINLANQAWGRPDVAAQRDEDRIVFKRLTKTEDE